MHIIMASLNKRRASFSSLRPLVLSLAAATAALLALVSTSTHTSSSAPCTSAPLSGLSPRRRNLLLLPTDDVADTQNTLDDADAAGRSPRNRAFPRRSLLFSPVYPLTGFLPRNPTSFSSWQSWQPRVFEFDVNGGELTGSLSAQRSGYTGLSLQAAAVVDVAAKLAKDEEEEEEVVEGEIPEDEQAQLAPPLDDVGGTEVGVDAEADLGVSADDGQIGEIGGGGASGAGGVIGGDFAGK